MRNWIKLVEGIEDGRWYRIENTPEPYRIVHDGVAFFARFIGDFNLVKEVVRPPIQKWASVWKIRARNILQVGLFVDVEDLRSFGFPESTIQALLDGDYFNMGSDDPNDSPHNYAEHVICHILFGEACLRLGYDAIQFKATDLHGHHDELAVLDGTVVQFDRMISYEEIRGNQPAPEDGPIF